MAALGILLKLEPLHRRKAAVSPKRTRLVREKCEIFDSFPITFHFHLTVALGLCVVALKSPRAWQKEILAFCAMSADTD